MTSLTQKQGQNFGWTVVYQPETGWPTTLSGVTVSSTFMDSNGVPHALTVVKDPGNLQFSVTGSTATWSIGVGYIDIKFISGGSTWYSETVNINVVKHITA